MLFIVIYWKHCLNISVVLIKEKAALKYFVYRLKMHIPVIIRQVIINPTHATMATATPVMSVKKRKCVKLCLIIYAIYVTLLILICLS